VKIERFTEVPKAPAAHSNTDNHTHTHTATSLPKTRSTSRPKLYTPEA
jgi:hypothetical protein